MSSLNPLSIDSPQNPATGAITVSGRAQVRWPVLIGSGASILAIALWAIIWPENAGTVIGATVGWVSTTFGWYFVLLAGIVVAFVGYLALSRNGRIKLGPDHSKPQYNMFTWASMLFAAGIGIDLMFFSVSEPAAQYLGPPEAEGQTVEAARQAIVWTLFHYGPVGWAMYALLGGAFAYFAYRRNLPLNIRSLLTPLFGKRLDGGVGHTIDIFAVLGAVFGIAVSLGIGVVQLSYGLHVLFGTPNGLAMQIALIVLAVVITTISTVTGVDKGIRRFSELNTVLAIVLLLWILVTGETRRLFDGLVMNVGDFVSTFPSILFDTFAWTRPDDWAQAWTLFFWAWWVAWAPFVGLFLARISRGRTLRQFITGVLVVPFAFILLFVSIFGNSTLEIIVGGDLGFAETAANVPEQAFFGLLEQYPGAPALMAIALVTGMLFYVTSADSGSLVLANLSSRIEDPKQDAAKPLRLFWAVATGLLTLGMLIVGGVPTLQQATVIIGLPVSVLLYLVMISLFRALHTEHQHAESYTATMPIRFGHTEQSWRKRLRQSTVFPVEVQAERYVNAIAEPAFRDVADELRKSGMDVEVERGDGPVSGVGSLLLTVRFDEQQPFTYQVYPVAHDLPGHARPHDPGRRHYVRLEVFTASGSHGYDVYGHSADRLISDVLGHFESHLEYLRISAGGSDASVGEDEPIVTNWSDDFEQADAPPGR